MKKGIHPQFYTNALIKDNSSGSVFRIGSTVENITVEISSITHPFYTGKQRIVDTDNLVEKFEKKMGKIDKNAHLAKKVKKVARRKSSVKKIDSSKALTLKDMLKSLK